MLLRNLIYLLAPSACIVCHVAGRAVCDGCVPRVVSYRTPVCYRCNRLSDAFKTCRACRNTSSLYAVVVASHYNETIRQLLSRFKYERSMDLAKPLGGMLNERLRPAFDIVVPVPSSTKRLRQRGYNPAGLLAKEVARAHKKPYVHALRRVGHSRQVGSGRQQRVQQLQGAFYATNPERVRGKKALLVDDVLTTGSTLQECADVLRVSGAKRVSAAVVARH